MSNVTYQIERIEGDMVTIRETYDLTSRNGPGILTRGGQIVDCEREGIRSAARFVTMTKQQAVECGLIPRKTNELVTVVINEKARD